MSKAKEKSTGTPFESVAKRLKGKQGVVPFIAFHLWPFLLVSHSFEAEFHPFRSGKSSSDIDLPFHESISRVEWPGRMRKNMLGKRVDYSARTVIVVDPTLKLDEQLGLDMARHGCRIFQQRCGLPYSIAKEPRFGSLLIYRPPSLTVQGVCHEMHRNGKVEGTPLEDIGLPFLLREIGKERGGSKRL